MDVKNLTTAQEKSMQINILKFNILMRKAYAGTLTSTKEVCGFTMLAPINDRKYTIALFHGYPVAKIYAHKEIKIMKFNPLIWGKMRLKYDVLCEVCNDITGIEAEPIEEIDLTKKKVTKKKTTKKK